MVLSSKPKLYRLRDIISRKGVTQSELAEMTGINYTNLNQKINGNMALSFNEAIAICKALNISLDVLSGDYVTNTKLTS